VVGIHTEVGKTHAAACVTEALDGYYWKPVQCGLPRDTEWVQDLLSQKERCFEEKFLFHAACSPHLAAKEEGIVIRAEDLIPPACPHPLIIEGTGGLLSPLNEQECWVDAAMSWQAQFILVYRPYLGSYNHFFLTIEAMRQRNLRIIGIIFNTNVDPKEEEMLLERARTICLGRLPWHKSWKKEDVQRMGVDLQKTLCRAIGL